MSAPQRKPGEVYAPAWVEAVTLDTIADQRERGWPDFHPEDFCHRCGRRNPVWWTSGDQWRIAASERARGLLDILCPSCFVSEWERTTGISAMWELRLDPRSGGQA